MRRLLLLAGMVFALQQNSHAQTAPGKSRPPIFHVYKGYIVRIDEPTEGQFNYTVFKNGIPIVQGKGNQTGPTLTSPISHKEAFREAELRIRRIEASPTFQPQVKKRTPGYRKSDNSENH